MQILLLSLPASVLAASQPHICHLLADDLGWNDVGYHNQRIRTPHLDALAADGIKLESFYTQLVCSPSRAAIMTGKYPFRLGLSHGFIAAGAPYGLPESERTIAEELRDANYSTHIVGKWHLGMARWSMTPTYRGFHSHFGFYNGAVHYWAHTHPERDASSPLDFHQAAVPGVPSTPVRNRNGTASKNTSDYGPFVYAQETVRIIEAHKSANDPRPLYLYLTHQSTHEPIDAPASYIAQYASVIEDPQRRIFAGMVTALDDAVHIVVTSLKQAGYWNNTLFVFHSDNGGNLGAAGNNWPLRGGKYSLFEGGTRVVSFWSGGLIPRSIRGTTSSTLIHEVDLFPTFLGLAQGQDAPSSIDGVNQWDAVTKPGEPAPRTQVIYNIDPCAYNDHVYANFSAIRDGKWKYIDAFESPANTWKPLPSSHDLADPTITLPHNSTRGPWLFDLEQDPNERTNLLTSHPQAAAKLKALLAAAATEAVRPFNCKGAPGSHKLPLNVTTRNGVWTPWDTKWGFNWPTCTTCKRPAWGWETVGHMSFTHTCNVSGPWSEEALDVLQRFPMVNIERFMGQHQSCFRRHRDQWGLPGCWLNATNGNPSCDTWLDRGSRKVGHRWRWASAGLKGCNCTTEEAPLGATRDARGLYVEDHAIAALRQLKARNPEMAGLLYHDSARMWTGDQIDAQGRIGPQSSRRWNPTVFRADDAVVKTHPQWLLRNSTGGIVWDYYANNHIYDFSQPGMWSYWAEVCLNATATGVVDGCFADGASFGEDNPAAPGQPASDGVRGIMREWGVTRIQAEAWILGHRQSLEATSTALGHGILVANGGRSNLTQGFMIEAFKPTKAMIESVQAAAADGVLTQVHANMYGYRIADVRDALAAFLIATGPWQFFSGPDQWQINQTCTDPLGIVDIRRRWLPEYDKPLGEARGLGQHDPATNVSTRVFQSGTAVIFNHSAHRGTIRWSDGTVTQGPGCVEGAPECSVCYPPLYEEGSFAAGTGGCVIL